MKKFVERLCLDVIITAVLSVVLGVVFFLYPVETVETIARIVAVIIFIFGVAQIAMGMVGRSGFSVLTAVGILITAIGIWMFIYPKALAGVIPFFIGLLILSHGITGVKVSVDAAKCKYEKWGVLFALSVISIVAGILCVLHAFDLVVLTAKIVGVFLVYDGIADVIVAIRARMVVRRFERALLESQAVDVEATVIDAEEVKPGE